MIVLFKRTRILSKERVSFFNPKKERNVLFAFFFRVKKELKCSFLRPNLTQKERCGSQKECCVLICVLFEFLATYETQKNVAIFLRSF